MARRALRRPQTSDEQPREPVVKPPLPLPLCFMLSHLEDDGPVRLDGVKLGVFEVMGLELDEPKLGAFAGALNALDFPLQLLIRQHPPALSRMRERLQETQPGDLPPQTRAAAESLRGLLTTLERRDGKVIPHPSQCSSGRWSRSERRSRSARDARPSRKKGRASLIVRCSPKAAHV